MSIGYVNYCSSVQDHIQKFSVYLKWFWKNKWEQWNQQRKGNLKHMEKVLLKSSAPEVMMSSKAPHQKQDHQKLKIIRRWKNQSFKGCSKDLITSSIAEDQKSKATTNSNESEGIGCLFFEECWQSTIVQSVQPLMNK